MLIEAGRKVIIMPNGVPATESLKKSVLFLSIAIVSKKFTFRGQVDSADIAVFAESAEILVSLSN